MKGGVCKTTGVMNLGAALMRLKQKVLLVDVDPQYSLTSGLGAFDETEDEESNRNVYGVIEENVDVNDAIVHCEQGYDLLPAHLNLFKCEVSLVVNMEGRAIKNMLEKLKADYDIILIDTPPGLGALLTNAVVASDVIIVPVTPEPMSLKGLSMVKDRMEWINEKFYVEKAVSKIFFTNVDNSRNLTKATRKILTKNFNSLLFKTEIRRNVHVAETYGRRTDIFDYYESSKGAVDYMNLAKEVLKYVKKSKS